MGKHQIRVCKTLSCWLMGADKVTACFKEKLGVEKGGVTPDGKFSLETVECLGACDMAPVVHVNETQYDKVTPDAARKLVEELK
jgi:NADH:ubiquinone oxidoreductase subunit E